MSEIERFEFRGGPNDGLFIEGKGIDVLLVPVAVPMKDAPSDYPKQLPDVRVAIYRLRRFKSTPAVYLFEGYDPTGFIGDRHVTDGQLG